ncbi:hypothetical protein, partial [Zavarzinella formosa]|uniref:hypothetical protein n=1 Tax=Zavarzinella formosa TaxID=360055 RepID=UPI000592FC98
AFASLKSQILELLPALSAVAVVEYGKRAIEAAGRIQDMADRIGFAASTISALESPLATSGASIEEFAGSISRMNNAIGTAAKGDPAAIKSFDELGLSVTKLAKLSPEDQFNAIAEAILKLGDQAKITEAGMNIFGRSFTTMLPALREANGNLQNLKKALSDNTVANLDDMGDAMVRVGLRIRDGFLDAVSASIDAVERLYGVARELSAKELNIEIAAKQKALASLPADEPVFDNLPPGVPAPKTPQALLRDQIAAL